VVQHAKTVSVSRQNGLEIADVEKRYKATSEASLKIQVSFRLLDPLSTCTILLIIGRTTYQWTLCHVPEDLTPQSEPQITLYTSIR